MPPFCRLPAWVHHHLPLPGGPFSLLPPATGRFLPGWVGFWSLPPLLDSASTWILIWILLPGSALYLIGYILAYICLYVLMLPAIYIYSYGFYSFIYILWVLLPFCHIYRSACLGFIYIPGSPAGFAAMGCWIAAWMGLPARLLPPAAYTAACRPWILLTAQVLMP